MLPSMPRKPRAPNFVQAMQRDARVLPLGRTVRVSSHPAAFQNAGVQK